MKFSKKLLLRNIKLKLYKNNLFKIIIQYGDWGLGIGDWGLGPIPNPQSPSPSPIVIISIYYLKNLFVYRLYDFL